MPATGKSELIRVTRKEFATLKQLSDNVAPDFALCKDADDTSIKDVIAHRAHWIGLFLDWYADGQAGKEVHFPAKGYKWNELPRYNGDLRAAQTHMTWAEAVTSLNTQHGRLMDLLEALPDTELYGGPMNGAKNHWTTGRWAEAAGASHYRSASKYIRARQRSAG